MTKQKKDLIWVYPPDNWVSNFNKTFVYGWCNPRAKLFVQSKQIRIPSNGNFAQVIQLPKKKNVIQLVQILNGKTRFISRNVIARRLKEPTKQSHNASRLLRSLTLPRNDVTIIIDPGHGGKEQGTHSPRGIPEKIFNLQIAKLLFKKCKSMAWHVHLTRTKDKSVSLKNRVNFAKKKKCNIFISIHHNALSDNEDPLKHRGVGIYYTHDFVRPFAKELLENISKESGFKKHGIFKRDFAVTRPDFYYGVLIECGFLIHPEEAECVIKKEIQKKIVRGIIKGILSFHTC
ncbi:MAG: N-acetylmuramoyl-L-alanine amidase [Candidatus Melainabacteria bacterium]|nr:N-acetylmuramoyl-L-alanine amidase [Candidatus Melainabacteria bacterium]